MTKKDEVKVTEANGLYVVEAVIDGEEIKTKPLSWDKAMKRAAEMRKTRRAGAEKTPTYIFVVAAVIIGIIALAMFKDLAVASASALGSFFAMIVAELWMTRK
jgi:hypothetical protein